MITTPQNLTRSGSETPQTDALRDECEDANHTHRECEHLLWRHSKKLEKSMRKLHAAYKQKVQGEIQLGHFDKEALTLLAELQSEHASLSENA